LPTFTWSVVVVARRNGATPWRESISSNVIPAGSIVRHRRTAGAITTAGGVCRSGGRKVMIRRTVKRRRLGDVILETVGRPAPLGVRVGGLLALFGGHAVTEPVDDLDVWWIAAAGRDLLATSAVPRVNAYSYTAPDSPWVMHELAFGLLYAFGLHAVG